MSDKRLSFWGWGETAKFPERQARSGIAQMASALLGGVALTPREPAALENAQLPAPRVEMPASWRDIATGDRYERARHCYGRSFRDLVRGFAGDFSMAADAIVKPRTEKEIESIFEWCAAHKVAVIPYGGGTSVVGGVEAAIDGSYNGAVCMDLGALDRVLEVDPVSRAARIQAGARGPVLEAQLAEHGLTLRHFPQSFELSTLGGWLATRAGGHFATVYTHIDDLTESIRMLTPAGVWESRRLPGSGAGPSPDRMVLGSEGTLGVITEAWMRLQARPTFRATASVCFAELEAAVTATREISQSGLFPSNCRLLDSREARLHQVVADGSHVLLLGFESADHALQAWMDRALQIARSHGGRCEAGASYKEAGGKSGDEGAAGTWKSAFIDAPYLSNILVSLGCIVDTFETACTWDRFDALHDRVVREVRAAMKEHCGTGLLSCRFTHVYPDGPAPYYTFIAPGRPGEELEQWQAIKNAAGRALMDCGATITHHHAVGRTHKPWYQEERPELFATALRAAKRELDPAGILNPGVLW